MNNEILSHFLPDALLNHFIVSEIVDLGEIDTKKMIIEINLVEKNQLPYGYLQSEYESKGFSSSSRIQDFPIRGKAVYLVIKRRRWRNKITKEQLTNDFSFITEGSKLTKELSDFLKDTGRYPSRYHK